MTADSKGPSDPSATAAAFEAQRAHLLDVARRMLGSRAEAQDVVQEAWCRLQRHAGPPIDDLRRWTTTVVARLCLDALRSRKTRGEVDWNEAMEVVAAPAADLDVEDSLGPALLGLLDTLTPSERLAFVLHDLFAVPFERIAPVLGKSAAATRQLASRGRRRVRGLDVDAVDDAREHAVVGAFLAAARTGELEELLAILDPDVVLRGDETTVRLGRSDLRGAADVARRFWRQAEAAKRVSVNGAARAAWVVDGRPKVIFDFDVVGDRIVAIDLLADAALLAELDVRLAE